MNKLKFDDPILGLNGYNYEVPSAETKALMERVKAWCKDKEIKIVLTTNPLVASPIKAEGDLYLPVIEDLRPQPAEFLLEYGNITNDVDGDYGLICLKKRVPKADAMQVVTDGRFSPAIDAAVVTFIPGAEETDEPRYTLQFWEKAGE